MTRDELLSRVSSSELTEWLAFEAEYDLPDIYFLVAQLSRGLASASWAGGGSRVADWVPYFAPPRKRQTTADHKAFFSAISRQRV
jgi:hypothetical protein